MLPSKSTKFFSEINDFLTPSDKGIFRIIHLYRKLELHKIKIGHQDFPQASYRRCDLLLCLLLLPVFQIKNVYNYLDSTLNQFFEARKNTFYRLKNDPNIDWRHIVRLVNKRLFHMVCKHSETLPDSPRCLIIDDTDFMKTSYKTEHCGHIWSHSLHRTILGFKALFMGYWDGKSFFALDFSLHKEKGKNVKKPYGLKQKQRAAQYAMPREKGSPAWKREQELNQNKITKAIGMVRSIIRSRILQVDYVLMDSWFFCYDFLKMLRKAAPDVHLLAIAKMGKTLYLFEGTHYTLRQLADLAKKRRKVRYNKVLNLYATELIVEYKGFRLKLFFCKNSKRGKWHVLVTTNTRIGVVKAYETYAIRWGVETFFKEAKCYFRMGKSQSQDFCGQIADISIAMMVYNIFSLAKRFDAYETIGYLFRQTTQQATEMTIYKRIWQFLLELLRILADIVEGDFNELVITHMKSEPENNKLLQLVQQQHFQRSVA